MSDQISQKATLKGYFETGNVPTQSQFDDLITSTITLGPDTNVIVSDNADYTLAINDSGKTFVYNGYGSVIFNLPAVDSSNLGTWYTILNLTPYKLTIQASGSDSIDDSDPGATIYNGEDQYDSQSTESSNSEQDVEQFASVKLQLCTETWWHILHGRHTWTTTKFV